MTVRQFTLKNGIGNTISLNDLDYFGYEPEGLGISFSNEFYGANANFLLQSSGIEMNQFSINILFGAISGNPYTKYRELISFLNYQPLYLIYNIPQVGIYEREVMLSELPKSEIGEYSVIAETLTLECLTPWYQWETYENKLSQKLNGEGKIYYTDYNEPYSSTYQSGSYIYPYIYAPNMDVNKNYVNINNDSLYLGSADYSPIEVTINSGENTIENPSWELLVDGEVVQNDRYFIAMEKNTTLIVSSEPQNQRAVYIGVDGKTVNIYSSQDMGKTNFVTAPIGFSTLRFDGIDQGFTVRVRKEYVVL